MAERAKALKEKGERHCNKILGPDSDGHFYCKDCGSVSSKREELQKECPRN
jgi:hypothetical protein